MERKAYIDMTKGIGILLVVFGHSMSQSNFIVEWQCSFFMPLFFLCSGLCYKQPKSVAQNAKKILIPYYIWGGVGFGIDAVLSLLQKEAGFAELSVRLVKLLLGMSMWNYPLWFLVAFFVCKCIFDTLVKVSENPKNVCLFSFLCLLAGLILSLIKNKYGFFFPFRLDIGLVMVPFMMLGYYAKEHVDKINQVACWKKLAVMALSLLINLASHITNGLVSVNSSEYGNPILFIISAVSGTLFILALCQIISRGTAIQLVLSWYGRNSMSIMCVHAIVLAVITKALIIMQSLLTIGTVVRDYVAYIVCILLMLPVCMCFDKAKS